MNKYFITSVIFIFLQLLKLELWAQLNNPFPGTVIFQSKEDPLRKKVASPSILILGNGDYLVSHDYERGTIMHLSKNKGKSWKEISRVSPIIWANLFKHKDNIYLMGTTKGWGNIVIYQSSDNGHTWTSPKDENSGILASGMYHTGPVPIVKYKGKIWRAFEEAFDPDNRRDFHAFAMCIDENADLLKASNWKRTTNSIRFDEAWINANRPNWLEGNIVVTPGGKLVDFMRLETRYDGINYQIEGAAKGIPRNEVAAIIDIDETNMKMIFNNESRNFIHFPGAETKFTIRYDDFSKTYYSITNKITSFNTNFTETYNGNWHQRNVLVLMTSKDLIKWDVKRKLIRWNEGMHTRTWDTFGFQYVDWQFENQDIIFVSRTSWYGGRYHDANMVTFHRIVNFRDSMSSSEPEDLIRLTTHPELLSISPMSNSIQKNNMGFEIGISLGKGLVQDSEGKITYLYKSKISEDEEQSKTLQRFIDITVKNKNVKNFSLETLDYTPFTTYKGIKLKWFYGINGNFTPITNYLQPIENINNIENITSEPRLYLDVYKNLNRINGKDGVTFRIYLIGALNEENYMQFIDKIKLGGRVLK